MSVGQKAINEKLEKYFCASPLNFRTIIMNLYFYYVDEKYIDYLKKCECNKRGFTCVPNVNYGNTKKFTFGAVLSVNNVSYFVPVSFIRKNRKMLYS